MTVEPAAVKGPTTPNNMTPCASTAPHLVPSCTEHIEPIRRPKSAVTSAMRVAKTRAMLRALDGLLSERGGRCVRLNNDATAQAGSAQPVVPAFNGIELYSGSSMRCTSRMYRLHDWTTTSREHTGHQSHSVLHIVCDSSLCDQMIQHTFGNDLVNGRILGLYAFHGPSSFPQSRIVVGGDPCHTFGRSLGHLGCLSCD